MDTEPAGPRRVAATIDRAGGRQLRRSSQGLALEQRAGAEIRYTLDGSAPGPNDARYDGPIQIDGPTVLRARAYKNGLTRSVISQQTYLVGQ